MYLSTTMAGPEMENNHQLIPHHDIVQMICTAMPEVLAIYLFGSHSLGLQHADSDIDLAILPQQKLSEIDVWALAQSLAAKYSRDVDLIDLKQASTVMRMQVISKGERLYCSDEQSCEVFEDFVFSNYAHFNEERAGILKDICQRGTVYG